MLQCLLSVVHAQVSVIAQLFGGKVTVEWFGDLAVVQLNPLLVVRSVQCQVVSHRFVALVQHRTGQLKPLSGHLDLLVDRHWSANLGAIRRESLEVHQ